MGKFTFFLVLACIVYVRAAKTINTHLSANDLERLNKVFSDGLSSNDLQSIHYSAINSKQIPAEYKKSICDRLPTLYTESKLNEFEKNFYFAGTHKHVGCSNTIPTPVVAAIEASLTKESKSAHELYFNYFGRKSLGGTIDETIKADVAKKLQNILKSDDSLSSVGYALNVAAELGSHGSSLTNWIEGAFAQADEVDGKLLQFEGGLSITALVVNGAFKLSAALRRPAPINEDQVAKFVAYFLSRRSVQQPKGASILVEVLSTIVADKTIAPVCIQVIGNGQLQPESPVVNVKIVDVLGHPLTSAVSSITATVTAKADNTILVSKSALTAKSSDRTVYALDLTPTKPARGIYVVDIVADSYKQAMNVKVLGKVTVKSLEVGVGETDSTSALQKQTVTFPNKLSTVLNADQQQKVLLKTLLVDAANNKPITVHQAFVLLQNTETKEEIIFVAEQDTTKSYKFDLDVGARGSDFGHKSGLYSVTLIVGDASLSNSFKWHVADLELKFSQEHSQSTRTANKTGNLHAPRPEIIHQFRQPDVRPPRIVSDVFTALCAAPLLILLILWAKLGVNVSNFPISLSALGFHLGFGGILALFGIFWLKLDMFETLRLMIPLGLVTLFFGNRLLRSIAARKSSEQK